MISPILLLACLPAALAVTQCSKKGAVTVTDKVLLSVNSLKSTDGTELATIKEKCGEPTQSFVGKDECASAAEAAAAINQVLAALEITSIEQAAAGIAQMIGESGGFQMGRNHYGTRQDGKDCFAGCDVGYFGKGTYCMWPPESLAVFAVTEGVVTAEQVASMSGEEVLALINGPTNPYAYGAEFWFFKRALTTIRSGSAFPYCDGFVEALDQQNLIPWRQCLANAQTEASLTQNIDPTPYFKGLVDAIKENDCAPFEPSPAVVLTYPAGVKAINAATVSAAASLSENAAGSSIPASDWTYSGFKDAKPIMTTIGAGEAGSGDHAVVSASSGATSSDQAKVTSTAGGDDEEEPVSSGSKDEKSSSGSSAADESSKDPAESNTTSAEDDSSALAGLPAVTLVMALSSMALLQLWAA